MLGIPILEAVFIQDVHCPVEADAGDVETSTKPGAEETRQLQDSLKNLSGQNRLSMSGFSSDNT